ncbi:MAG: dihydropteroate synthase [Alphaproteobacteria bacterium]|nr:dihydropteroate synthase [Alphaproteobacteria bacterium]
MGIVNVTPDSFSDGGDHFEHDAAIKHGLKLMKEGAHILDIGGESTRPGSNSIYVDEEIKRTIPVIKALKEHGATISIDTRNAPVMKAAMEAGSDIINDISALTDDGALEIAAESEAYVSLMHMLGNPSDMQEKPSYSSAHEEIADYLKSRIDACLKAGIKKDKICIDPGIGFGKTLNHNLDILANMQIFKELGHPILLGVSKKSFIEQICKTNTQPKERFAGSIAATLACLDDGVSIIRTHDVAETLQAVKVWEAIRSTKNNVKP